MSCICDPLCKAADKANNLPDSTRILEKNLGSSCGSQNSIFLGTNNKVVSSIGWFG
ncbi:hypothetical protein LOAG_01693 [Loa loa]|uniref:Uncharacterized protein n=1 Tax=Loa loa TaxID=7209 RepID=A0A1S0U864_LOALO|nr:hypothetical protein LOAG_01693 [Loa loa]EFO26791.1 hypothetical protein LOAG_01693 [Loa loa]